ncbi:aminotransferase [Acinetobacter sp. RF15A]|uniref:aminotransferase n=1 Tax=unclassified Acinetobacter TaxID=196816 RepID=UPI0011922DC9|nr:MULTISPECIES: aminotransferase [unclassified Acinetobacter]TSH73979.1 aminotransferase [Acinetobacter sp. RF15A]TSI20364.1 aminotransferase [Acinetobacter sp. RF15B]
MKIKAIISVLLVGLPCAAFATVGGPQNIEVLGYEVKDQKLYLMRHYLDGRGRLPQLYYYNFKSKQPNQLVMVNSLYISPKTKRIDYDQSSQKFDQEIAKIKKRLIPVIPVKKQNIRLELLKTSKGYAPAWYDPQKKVPKWTYQYQVKSGSQKSPTHQAVSYQQGLKISQAYKVPKQNKTLVTVKYLGIPFETGYTIEDPVLLRR